MAEPTTEPTVVPQPMACADMTAADAQVPSFDHSTIPDRQARDL